MTTIRATIEKLRELYEKATPGEWPTKTTILEGSIDLGNEVTNNLVTHIVNPDPDYLWCAEAHNAMPALLGYIEKLERVAEAAQRLPVVVLKREGLVVLAKALEELDALDSEAFDRRNFTYSNDGRSITILNADDSYSFNAKDVAIITKP